MARNADIQRDEMTESAKKAAADFIVMVDEVQKLVVAKLDSDLSKLRNVVHPATWEKIEKSSPVKRSVAEQIAKVLKVEFSRIARRVGEAAIVAEPALKSSGGQPQGIKRVSRPMSQRAIQTALMGGATELWASIDRGSGVIETVNGLPDAARLNVKRVMMKQMLDSTVDHLQKIGAIAVRPPRARELLAESIQERLPNAAISFSFWESVPPFHGMHAGDCLVYGYWQAEGNPGKLTVNGTQMYSAHISSGVPMVQLFIEQLKHPGVSDTSSRLAKK